MRIINLTEFRKLVPGTVFMKYDPSIFGGLRVKQDNSGSIDFIYESITDEIECSGSDELMDLLDEAENDSSKSITLDFHCTSRDGLYEKGQLFAVYEKNDVVGLTEKLQYCISRAYT